MSGRVTAPVDIGIKDAIALSDHCALRKTGEVMCWRLNRPGGEVDFLGQVAGVEDAVMIVGVQVIHRVVGGAFK